MLEDLRVLGIQLHAASPPPDKDAGVGTVLWSAKFYDPEERLGSGEVRIVIASLHAHAEDGWGTVTVGGTLTPLGSATKSKKKLAEKISDSIALETMYDFARVTFKSIAGTVDLHLALPYKSPDATVKYGEEGLMITDAPELEGQRQPALDGVDAPNSHTH